MYFIKQGISVPHYSGTIIDTDHIDLAGCFWKRKSEQIQPEDILLCLKTSPDFVEFYHLNTNNIYFIVGTNNLVSLMDKSSVSKIKIAPVSEAFSLIC